MLHDPRPHDQSECTNVSHSKTQFLAENILRSTRVLIIKYCLNIARKWGMLNILGKNKINIKRNEKFVLKMLSPF